MNMLPLIESLAFRDLLIDLAKNHTAMNREESIYSRAGAAIEALLADRKQKNERLVAERDECERRAKLWERLHDERTKALRSIEEKVDAMLKIKGDYDGYKVACAGSKILEELTTEIANAADAQSYADLAASGGIVDAP
jgi:hypothetical protein